MKAALLNAFGAPLEVTEVAAPNPGMGEVLVRTAACGICRTDLHIIDGTSYRPVLPHILGHEPAGTVAALGPAVDGWAVGEPVVSYLFDSCGHCDACHAGSEAQCENQPAILGVTRDGGFAEFFVARADNLLRVPPEVPLHSAGLVSCAAVTAVRALQRAALVPGCPVGIIGAGGIGMLVLQLLVAEGFDVVVVDPSPQSRRRSRAEGASTAYTPKQAAAATGRLARVFDLVGSAASTRLAGAMLARRGRIVIVGEQPDFPAIDSITIAQREIEIVGTRNGSRADARAALALMENQVMRPRIARQVPLETINAGLELLRSGKAQGRVVVEVGT